MRIFLTRCSPDLRINGRNLTVKLKSPINNFFKEVRTCPGVGLAEAIAYQPVNQMDPGSNPTRGNRLKSDP